MDLFSWGAHCPGWDPRNHYQNTVRCSGPKLECVRSSWIPDLWVNTLVADQCPNPGLGADSPGDDQEHAQMLYGGLTGHTHSILLNSQMLNQPDISVFSTLILSNTHNPVPSGLAIKSFDRLFWHYIVLNKGAVSSPKTFNGNISVRCQGAITVDSPCCGINPVGCLPLFCHYYSSSVFETGTTLFGKYQNLFGMIRWLKCTFAEHPRMSQHSLKTNNRKTFSSILQCKSVSLSLLFTRSRKRLLTKEMLCSRLWAWLWLHMVQDVYAGVCI